MKELYVNNAGKNLVEDMGFLIVNTPFIPYLITEYTYIKDKWGTLHIVNFIDSDKIDFSFNDTVSSNFYKELYFLKEKTNANAVIYYKILVTEHSLSQDYTENILKSYMHSLVTKASFIPIIIDISNKKVITNIKDNIDKIGVINMLNDLLNTIGNNNRLYNLNEIQEKVNEDYTYNSSNSQRKIRKPYITYSLMTINIALFIIMELVGGTQNPYVLNYFGIKINSLIVEGEYWRLVTSAFIHIGFAHVAFNMYGLFNLGSFVERIYGRKKYLFIYLSAALWGSISSFIFSPIPSAGASGAIFGLLGALMYLGQKKPKLFTTSFGINILIVLAFNLIYGFSNSGIDNYAHIGGLLGGYISSNASGLEYEKGYDSKKLIFFIFCILFLIVGIVWGVRINSLA